MQRGTITGFSGSWGSGIGYLLIDGVPVPCENAATVRALEACFGNAIGEGHAVNEAGFVGEEIVYEVAAWGVLEWFAPADQFDALSV